MAEVLGFVSAGAGLLSLAIQLQENAFKLKDLCSSIRHADERLKQLIFDLETEALLLRKIESLRQNTDRQDELFDRCLATCRRHASEVDEAASAITAQMQRFAKAGKLYWALKEHIMDKICANLDKAKNSLHLAWAMFMHQEQELQLLANRKAMTAMTAMLTQSITGADIAEQQAQVDSTSLQDNTTDIFPSGGAVSWRKRQRRPRWRLRFSNWFNSTIWDIAVHHAEGSWSVNLRVQSHRPFDPETYRLCKHGHISQLQQLVTKGRISFTDVWSTYHRRPWTENLLSLAAQYGQLALCKWLLLQTSWPDHLLSLEMYDDQWQQGDRAEAYRAFVEYDQADVDLDFSSFWPRNVATHRPMVRPKECISIILRAQTTPYAMQPIHERLRFAQFYSLRGAAVDAYLEAFGVDASNASLATAETSKGWTALHQVAGMFWWPAYSPAWSRLGIELLKSGANASALGMPPPHGPINQTPLLARLIKRYEFRGSNELAPCSLQSVLAALDDWLSMLTAADIDLQVYCDCESIIWEDLGISNDFDPAWRGLHQEDVGWEMMQEKIGSDFYPSRLVSEPDSTGGRLLNIECRSYSLVRTFNLQHPAGSFPRSPLIPKVITWRPRTEENTEGPWTLTSTSILRGKPFDARIRRREEEKHEIVLTRDRLVRSAQDDASFVLLGERRCSLRRPSRKRSASVSTARAKFKKNIWPKGVFEWLPENLRLGLWNDTTQIASPLEDIAWYYRSFLSQIQGCQEDLMGHHDWIYKTEPAHTPGAPQCPWGCHLVNLSKLNVPDSCRRWHPKTRW